MIDRVTASRLGIAPTTIDNTLYDAYGQRHINTLYTQLNQYHVVLETAPQWAQNPANLGDLYIQGNASAGATGAGCRHIVFVIGLGLGRLQRAHHLRQIHAVFECAHRPPARSAQRRGRAGNTPNTTTSSAGSHAIPLSAFTQATPTTEPLSINHQGQFPAVTVSFNLAPNASLGTAITDIDKVCRPAAFPRQPPGLLPGHRRRL